VDTYTRRSGRPPQEATVPNSFSTLEEIRLLRAYCQKSLSSQDVPSYQAALERMTLRSLWLLIHSPVCPSEVQHHALQLQHSLLRSLPSHLKETLHR
jgi:hypothetical protein